MGQEEIAAIAVALGAMLSAITLAVVIGRPLRKLLRQNEEFREDWYGAPARPGRDAVPGVPERLAKIEQELRPNADALAHLQRWREDHIMFHMEGTRHHDHT